MKPVVMSRPCRVALAGAVLRIRPRRVRDEAAMYRAGHDTVNTNSTRKGQVVTRITPLLFVLFKRYVLFASVQRER